MRLCGYAAMFRRCIVAEEFEGVKFTVLADQFLDGGCVNTFVF
jgi:hypothetical protein